MTPGPFAAMPLAKRLGWAVSFAVVDGWPPALVAALREALGLATGTVE